MYAINNVFDILSLAGTDVFFGCNELDITFESVDETSLNLSNSNINTLGNGAFENCTSIDDLVLTDTNITVFNTALFKGCINLTSAIIPDTLTEFKASVFENCTNLTKIELTNTITSVGDACFKNCINLEEIYIKNSSAIISPTAFTNSSLTVRYESIVVLTGLTINSPVYTTLTTNYPNVTIIDELYYDGLIELLKKTMILLDVPIKTARKYVYPSLGIRLTNNSTVVLTTENIVNQQIDPNKLAEFRYLLITFIFEYNNPYTSFLINPLRLRLTNLYPQFAENTFVKLYASKPDVVNPYYDVNTLNNITHLYTLIPNEPNYNEYIINGSNVRIFKNASDKFVIRQSSNNFATFQDTIIEPNSTSSIDNYNLIFGETNEFMLYMNLALFNPAIPSTFYLNDFTFVIEASKATIRNIADTEPFTADAYAEINVPVSVASNTFQYWSDAINVDDVRTEDLKFRTQPNLFWNTFYLTRANVYENHIAFYRNQTDVMRYQIKYDFVRYLALKIFKTAQGADIFNNNDAVTNNLDTISNAMFNSKLNAAIAEGEFYDQDISGNIPRSIFYQMLNNTPERISPNAGEWTPMPFYSGENLFVKLIINPNSEQRYIINGRDVGLIPERSYSIKMKLIPG
jgi:hypothetical protein